MTDQNYCSYRPHSLKNIVNNDYNFLLLDLAWTYLSSVSTWHLDTYKRTPNATQVHTVDLIISQILMQR